MDGSVTQRTAKYAEPAPPDHGALMGPATWVLVPVKSTVTVSPSIRTVAVIGTRRSSAMPSLSM